MANEDDQCFKWATTKALNLVKREKNAHRITVELERHAEELNWDGIKFPTPCVERMYKKFEENNDNVSLLVFGHVGSGEDLRIIPLYFIIIIIIITTLFEYGAISLFIKIYKTIYKEQKRRKRKN